MGSTFQLLQYQFSIAVLIQNYVLRLHVSVDDASTVEIGQRFDDTCCVELGAAVIKVSSETIRSTGNKSYEG